MPHRTSVEGESNCRKGLYLIRHNIHKRQTSIPKAIFEPAVAISERPQSCALDRVTMWLNFEAKTAGDLTHKQTAGSGMQVLTGR